MGVHCESVGEHLPGLDTVVVGERTVPFARQRRLVDPGQRATIDPERVRAGVIHSLNIPRLNTRRDGRGRIVAVRGVESAVDYDAAVKVDDGTRGTAVPLQYGGGVGFVVFGDGVVVDGVEVGGVDSDALVGIGGVDEAEGGRGELLLRSGGAVEGGAVGGGVALALCYGKKGEEDGDREHYAENGGRGPVERACTVPHIVEELLFV